METRKNSVASRVKAMRIKRGLSQEALANKIGYKSAGPIGRIERGNKIPSERIGLMAKALGVSTRWLLYGDTGKKYSLYASGQCPNGKTGGYGAIIVDEETGQKIELCGGFYKTTPNRAEILAVIAALEFVARGSEVTIYSTSEYLVKTRNLGWSVNKNKDLWEKLDKASFSKKLMWVKSNDELVKKCALLAKTSCDGTLQNDPGYKDYESIPAPQVEEPESKPVIAPEVEPIPEPEVKVEKIEPRIIEPEEPKEEPEPEKTPVEDALHKIIKLPQVKPAKIKDVKRYANFAGISIKCAESIKEFYSKEEHTKEDYLNLKTFGLDQYSRMKIKDFKRTHPRLLKAVSPYFEEEKDI